MKSELTRQQLSEVDRAIADFEEFMTEDDREALKSFDEES